MGKRIPAADGSGFFAARRRRLVRDVKAAPPVGLAPTIARLRKALGL